MLTENVDCAVRAEAQVRSDALLKRIAVVRMWDNLQTAEDEVMARIANSCKELGVEVITIDTSGQILGGAQAGRKVSSRDVDFVIHLHFETPKTYDAFSFVALWNPLAFYFEWGYRNTSNHLITHDDFLSCGSRHADDHVKRLIANDSTHLEPELEMFHSLSSPIIEPRTGSKKLFYVGINWDKIGKGKGRHDDLLKRLDETGKLVIYGPEVFLGIRVWEGFKSYKGSLPFDGVSIIRAISEAGVVLALSSEQHLESALMSNRLFEGVAAGANVIVDENEFARRHFGNSLLYIDTIGRGSDEITRQVEAHLEWIDQHPEQARLMAVSAQEVFQARFNLKNSLDTIFRNLPERRARIAKRYLHRTCDYELHVVAILSSCSQDIVERMIQQFEGQSYPNKRLHLICDHGDQQALSKRWGGRHPSEQVVLCAMNMYGKDASGKAVKAQPLGACINEWLRSFTGSSNTLISIIMENEEVFADHYSALIRAFEDDSDLEIAYSDVILTHADSQGKAHFRVSKNVRAFQADYNQPNGSSRFLFRYADTPFFKLALPYLGWGLVDALYSKCARRKVVSRATCIIDIQRLPYQPDNLAAIERDRNLLVDVMSDGERRHFAVECFGEDILESKVDTKLRLEKYTFQERQEIIAKLLEGLELPGWLLNGIRKAYATLRKLRRRRQ